MTSSSAFSNVLSAPASPPKNTPAARGLGDESDGPAFTQALADLRAEHKVKTKEPMPKKLAADEKPQASIAAPDHKVKTAAGVEESNSLSPEQSKLSETEEAPPELVTTAGEISNPVLVDPLFAMAINPLANPITAEVAAPVAQTVLTIAATEANADTLVQLDPAISGNMGETLVSEADAQLPASLSQSPSEQVLAEPLATAMEVTVKVDAAPAAIDPAANVALNPTSAGQLAEAAIAAAVQSPNTLKQAEDKSAIASPTPSAEVEDALLASGEQATAEDPQAVFEKMLQAIAGNVTAKDAASGAGQKAVETAAAQIALAGENSPLAAPAEGLTRAPEATLPAARNFLVQTAVPVTVGQPQWSQAVGEKVLWLAAQNVQSAEIRLDPPELGPMQVRVHVQQEQASVTFTSHNPHVREQLDQSLNRLRDMFNEQGLNLVNVDVSDKSFQRQQGEGGEQQDQASREQPQEEETVQAISAIAPQRLVDHYA